MRQPVILLLAGFLLTRCTTTAMSPSAFRPEKLREIDAAIETAIIQKKTPGAIFHLERNGSVYQKVYGRRALVPAEEAMTENTIFDVASFTKVTATTPSIWLLIERGRIALDDPVSKFIPEFRGSMRDDITIRHLLTHTSGLAPDLELTTKWSGYDTAIHKAIYDEVPINRPGFVFRYSDINFELLGEIVQRLTGMTLDQFARKEIYVPLKMTETGFLPDAALIPRIAPTEQVEGEGMLRGKVHDPTARRMGGIAGHAGLFSTAHDLARYARMLLSGGELDGVRIFKPETVRAMTAVQSPPGVTQRRAGGWDIDSGFSRPRGLHFPIGSYGHTGWTGTILWIDPFSKTFYLFLSNRVHPDGTGSITALQKTLGTLAAEAVKDFDFTHVDGSLPPRQGGVISWVTGGGNASNGIDVLIGERFKPLVGKRVGLITNHTGIDKSGNPTIDLIRSAPGVELVALFSPEHGIRGEADEKVQDTTDPISGLPIYSLYGDRRKPSPQQLAGVDVLVYDIQDLGCRFYTYISTLALAMEAAAESRRKFVVLDRVDPINGQATEGPLLHEPPSFIAIHPLVVRDGMTVGELAKMFREERHLDVDLEVIPLHGWKRAMWQDEAGLPWINTSPNIRSLTAAGLYPGIGLLEGTKTSVGRGTATPFELFGAPWIDGAALCRTLSGRSIAGVVFVPVDFTPDASKFKGQPCHGARVQVSDRNAVNATQMGLEIARTLYELYPREFDVEHVNNLLCDPATIDDIKAGTLSSVIFARWEKELEEYRARRGRYLLYP